MELDILIVRLKGLCIYYKLVESSFIRFGHFKAKTAFRTTVVYLIIVLSGIYVQLDAFYLA